MDKEMIEKIKKATEVLDNTPIPMPEYVIDCETGELINYTELMKQQGE